MPALLKGDDSESSGGTRDILAQIRTQLAAERTFSAWIRTGLAGIGGGLAITRLIPFRTTTSQELAYIAGQLLVIWGAAIIVFALWHYWRTSQDLTRRSVSRLPLPILVLTTLTLFIVALLVLWLTLRAPVR